jgi:MFS family permease
VAQAERASLLNESERPTRKHYVILGMAWAGWLFDFYDLMLLSFLLVPIKRDLGLNDYELSLLLGTTLAATALGGILFGTLADRFGRKTVLTWTLLTYSAGTFLCGMSHAFWLFLVFRVLTGLGVGGEWATGQTLVGETFPARMRARFAAVMQTGAPLGILLASLVGSFVEPYFVSIFGLDWGWRACFFVSLLPAGLVIIIRRHMPESDVWESGQKTGRARSPGLIHELRISPTLRKLFILGLVLALADMSAYWFTYTWMPKYLYDQLGFSVVKSGLWMVVTQVAAFAGYLSFGVVADWKGRRWAYSVYSMVWALGLLGITWFWGTIDLLPWLPLAFMVLVGLGTGNFSGYGPIFSELFPTRIRNSAMGVAFNLSRGAQFFTPVIITWVTTLPLAHGHGLGAGISIGAFFALFTGLWVWTLPETKGTEITA